MRKAGRRMSKELALSRRDFVRSTALATTALAIPNAGISQVQQSGSQGDKSPIRLGLASYTFRNFARAQLIAFMKQVNVSDLNAKDVKDHLPTDPQQEAAALADYAAAGIKLHAAGALYFATDEDADIRSK